jgi:regulator of sigma E protease
MITLLAFAGAIAVLVVFHELGHYWVARMCDVKILRFSVGFGKVLYTRHFGKGETEWAVSAVPLGGYVKMLDEREGEVAAHELPRAFNRKPPLQRMAIVVAGPVANLLLAVILYWALFMYGIPGLKPVLGDIPAHTAAAAAQLQEQETIISIGGEAVPDWQELRWELLNLALQRGEVNITGRTADGQLRQHVLDMSQVVPADLDGDFMRKLGLQPYQPQVAPVIDRVIEESVAQHAGLQAGDTVLRIDGRAVSRWDELVEAVRSHPGRMLSLQIQRQGGQVTIAITPETVVEGGKQVGRIGAAPRVDAKLFESMLTTVRYPPFHALGQSLRRTWETSALSLKMIARMVIGQVSLKNLSGPITIADYAGQSAQVGLGAYLSFLAFISISLGILNLLPIPLLDGGHLLYYTVEFFKGGPVSERAWEIGQKIGISLLVTLMTFALYNDISRLVLGHQQ